MKKQILPLLLISFAMQSAAQKMYKVDSTYGTNGVSLTTPSASSTISHIEMNAVHLQDDGKVWEGGRVFFTGDIYWSTTIQKRAADGIRDIGYSGDGVKISEYQTNNQVLAMIPLKGDKMYAAVSGYGGYVARPDTAMISQVYNGMIVGPNDDINVAVRYNDSMVLSAGYGELIWYKDNGLGTGPNNYANSGYTTTAGTYIGSEYYDHQQYAIAVQGDGKYIVAGKFSGSTVYSKYAFLARYKAGYTFQLDSTFGTNGIQLINRPGTSTGTPYVACIAIEPGGTIVANVVATDSAAASATFAQGMRFNTNGTFKENIPSFPNARKLIVNADGIIFGLLNNGGVSAINPDGSAYTNFFGGYKPLDMAEFPAGAIGHLGRDMSMNASGDIVIVGYYNQSSSGTHSFTRKFKTYSGPTSIAYSNLFEGVKVYPNPSNGLFTVALKSDVKVEIISAAGQLVLSKELQSGHQQIDLSAAAAGLYFMKMTKGTESASFPILKQ